MDEVYNLSTANYEAFLNHRSDCDTGLMVINQVEIVKNWQNMNSYRQRESLISLLRCSHYIIKEVEQGNKGLLLFCNSPT